MNARPAPWLCLFGILAWSWAFFGAAILTGRPWLEFPTALFVAMGGLGPVVVPAMLIRSGRWDASLDRSAGSFFRRSLDPRTVSFRGYAVLLGVVLVLHLGPLILESGTAVGRLIERGAPTFLLVGFVFGALEEPGWRGYAQEALQRRIPAGAASLVIGLVWAVWHLPLFVIEGTYPSSLGVGTPAFWSYLVVLVATAPVFALLYNGAGQAAFAPALAHGLGNVVGEITVDPAPWAAAVVASVAGAIALIMAGRRPSATGPEGAAAGWAAR